MKLSALLSIMLPVRLFDIKILEGFSPNPMIPKDRGGGSPDPRQLSSGTNREPPAYLPQVGCIFMLRRRGAVLLASAMAVAEGPLVS